MGGGSGARERGEVATPKITVTPSGELQMGHVWNSSVYALDVYYANIVDLSWDGC